MLADLELVVFLSVFYLWRKKKKDRIEHKTTAKMFLKLVGAVLTALLKKLADF